MWPFSDEEMVFFSVSLKFFFFFQDLLVKFNLNLN